MWNIIQSFYGTQNISCVTSLMSFSMWVHTKVLLWFFQNSTEKWWKPSFFHTGNWSTCLMVCFPACLVSWIFIKSLYCAFIPDALLLRTPLSVWRLVRYRFAGLRQTPPIRFCFCNTVVAVQMWNTAFLLLSGLLWKLLSKLHFLVFVSLLHWCHGKFCEWHEYKRKYCLWTGQL